jgi:hypothetical protein
VARICFDKDYGQFYGGELSELEAKVFDFVFGVKFWVKVRYDTQVHHMQHVFELVGWWSQNWIESFHFLEFLLV